MTKKQQVFPALLEKLDTAWTWIIVSIALAMIIVLATLRSIGLLKQHEDDQHHPDY